MTLSDWATTAAVLAALIVLGITALDRRRMKQRLGNAEGVITGLTLDLEATHARVEQLQSYLNLAASWDVDADAPPTLADPRQSDRWSTAPADAAAETAGSATTGAPDAAPSAVPTVRDRESSQAPLRSSERQG